MEKEPPSGPYEWYVSVAFHFALICTAASWDALASMKDTKEPLNAGGDAALTFYPRDAWISFRSNDLGTDEDLAIQVYTLLTAKSWRVFYAPICLPGTLMLC